ncbi:hypothetical protein F5984_19140 [Rudanella paleaurantiibacter]|uniref:Uncharacterized protein n=1 Tax=Rudanella paleaurantiibacter TaxID=2614655 RepID=A0A7J5TUY8_9BACT|nr:hypothetical protein [Rudanella paleaurantiibacter]KAB7727887.1 hypothetical protein F5984_19140 [Rudanella paleaurantiibacter]
MKTNWIGFWAILMLAGFGSRAQTVYAGEQTIEKNKLSGLFLTLPVDEKAVSREWEQVLRSYGRMNLSRGVFRVTNADIPSVSSEPINLTSQLKGGKASTTLFASFDLGSGNFARPGDPSYSAAETLLKDFAAKALYNNEVRIAEESFTEAQKAHQRSVQKGERLGRDIERNKREKERLLRSLDENAKELDQLTKDVDLNKTEQENALTEMDVKKKNVETVKAKKQ